MSNARTGFFVALGLCCLLAVAASPASAQANPRDIALQHLSANAQALGLTADDLIGKVVTDEYRSEHNGVTHVYFKQRLGGIDVANGTINVNVGPDSRVLSVGNRFVGNLNAKAAVRAPGIIPETAIRQAAEQLGLEVSGSLFEVDAIGGPAQKARYSRAGLSLDEIPVKLAYYALDSGEVRLAWETNIRQVDQKHWWNLWVDAQTGEILAKVDWIAYDQYEVFALPKESPSDGPRTIEANPADSTASPFGWHDTNGAAGAEFTVTTGNNVCAQTDRNANNSACGTETQPDGGAGLDFTGAVVPLDLVTQSPADYQNAAVANLFYWNNIMHDLLYQYGFDEASGNFQENNYGNGGAGSDSVNADAQDGSGTNNANFATPPDGSNPRMQMFEWTNPNDAIVTVNSPASIAGDYTAAAADFGAPLTITGITGDFELVDDGTANGSEGCNALVGFTSGRVAMIDRGTCEFGTKVLNAENAGAIAAIVVNNQGDGLINMGPGAQGGSVSISSVFIGQTDGNTIKAQLGGGVNGTLKDAGNSIPNRDSDLDAGIIAHEYCHGLSNRLTGGPSNVSCLSGQQQAGEGWSDLCTLFFTPDAADTGTTPRGVGTYSLFEPSDGLGIRPFPYSTDMAVNPLTYGELSAGTLSVPHGIGTVWATAVWEMYWNLTDTYGFDADLYNGTGGNNTAIQLVLDGMKLQPCNPTFLDARDAILLADQQNNGGANECLIWEAFAKRGMGVNADDGGSANSLNVTENFDLPAQCITGCGNGICDVGESCDGRNGTEACPGDCISGTSSGAVCGNGICESGNGETCETCAADCAGQTNGKPSGRFCCGSADSLAPNGCGDSRCTSGGFQCTETPVPGGDPYCCGDLFCDGDETCGNCALDCTIGAEVCTGGVDEDCNCAVDCADAACTGDPACPDCADVGDSCRDDQDCCSGNCSGGKPSTRVCLAA